MVDAKRGASFTSSITRNMAPVSDLPEPGVSTMERVRAGAYLGEGYGVPGSGEGDGVHERGGYWSIPGEGGWRGCFKVSEKEGWWSTWELCEWDSLGVV